MSGYVSAEELRTVLSLPTYLAIFDDTLSGSYTVVDGSTAVILTLKRAHAEVVSYLPNIYRTMPAELPNGVPILLKSVELDYAVALSFQRHPEYVRTFGGGKQSALWDRAQAKMDRIVSTIQQIPPNDLPPEAQPETVGGITYDDSRRIISTCINGQWNGGDF